MVNVQVEEYVPLKVFAGTASAKVSVTLLGPAPVLAAAS